MIEQHAYRRSGTDEPIGGEAGPIRNVHCVKLHFAGVDGVAVT